MKKQFFRVKQLADQTFSRAGKTDVLSDDLQEADRKVEYIKTSCQNVGKKLSSCLLLGQLQGESGTKEKLLKKTPNYQLGASMVECSIMCDEDSLMKTILCKCGHAEKCLSEECLEHDYRVEQHVIAPLHNVLENDIPNIVKQKRNVTKVCLDMDSAKARYQQAQKHNSNTAGAAKVELIKDELKDSEQKVEQSRDVLACEMFQLAARESELCYTILQYYKFQKRYHEYALNILNSLIPELENEISSSKIKPVYGIHLDEHLRVTDRKIAFPIELCVCALLELGIEEEGLFRLAGAASKVKRMKLSFDAGCMTLTTALAYRDPHVIAGALKSYLRELPEPLLTHDLYDEWLSAAKAQTNSDNKLKALWTVVHKLPQANFDNLSYLIKFFHMLSKNHEVNKMCPHNIAIVIAPSLIWTKDENGSSGFGLNVNVSLYPSIIDLLVTYADWFFDKDMDFYQTLEPVVNGEIEEKLDKGIDNKGFDIKALDKMHRSVIEKSINHPGGDTESSFSEIKRSQSISSLSEEVHAYESPRPITRRKNKSLAPVPPAFKDDKKKDKKILKENSQPSALKELHVVSEKPDKPPRPNVSGNATLPRPAKSNREHKSTETSQENIAVNFSESFKNSQNEITDKKSLYTSNRDKAIKIVATISTNTDSDTQMWELNISDTSEYKKDRPVAAPRSVVSALETPEKSKPSFHSKSPEYNKVDLLSVKKEWLLGKDSIDIENLPPKKPAVPERPSSLKPQTFKFNRSSIDINLRNNYENISVFSNENINSVGLDERTLQKTQIYSIEKQQVAVVKVISEEKGNLSNSNENEAAKNKLSLETEKDDKEKADEDNIIVEERKTSTSIIARPLSLPGADKPERPPKPDYKFSSSMSSHKQTFSDGPIIDIKSSDNASMVTTSTAIINNHHNNNNDSSSSISSSSGSNNNNNNNNNTIVNNNDDDNNSIKYNTSSNIAGEITQVSTSPTSSTTIKHPQTSPPPPPIPAKPRANLPSESTNF